MTVGSVEKLKPSSFTSLAGLDGLGINLVTKEALFKEQFVLILNFLDNNTKRLLPHLPCLSSVTRELDNFKDVLTNKLPEIRTRAGCGAAKQSSVPIQPKWIDWIKAAFNEVPRPRLRAA